MQFEELLDKIKEPTPNYWHIIVDNAVTIVREVDKRNQGVVARDLGMSFARFNALMPLLREYSYEK